MMSDALTKGGKAVTSGSMCDTRTIRSGPNDVITLCT